MAWKIGVLAVAFLLWPAAASANCTPGMHDYVRAWPEDGAAGVPTDTHVLVHRYGQPAFLAATPALALRPGSGAPIPLRIVADLRSGSRGMAQRTLVLRPARALAPSTRYELTPLNPQLGYVTVQSFTTGAGLDATAPVVRRVAAGAFESIAMGCGPAHLLPIGVDAADDGLVWIRLRIARTAADVAAGRFVGEMILAVEDRRVHFGHEMCIGNWNLEPGQQWAAAYEVIDSALRSGASGTLALDARP